jgi:hypothetical protein
MQEGQWDGWMIIAMIYFYVQQITILQVANITKH